MTRKEQPQNKRADEDFQPVREFARKFRERHSFSSEALELAPNMYVGWLDLMGAGHLMSTSVHKSANFLARLHIAVCEACDQETFQGHVLAINDGVYLISPHKNEIMRAMRDAMTMLALFFVAVPRPHDRFFVRGGIAFGPVYSGTNLRPGISKKSTREKVYTFDQVAFGPPIIAAFKSEGNAPPFGIAVHESARSFAPNGVEPFRMTHWLWWQKQDEVPLPKSGPSLPALRDCLKVELEKQFEWMRQTLLFHELPAEKIESWKTQCSQYFFVG